MTERLNRLASPNISVITLSESELNTLTKRHRVATWIKKKKRLNYMRNAGLEEAKAGIKIAGRYINNLRYADITTLMAEIKELRSF